MTLEDGTPLTKHLRPVFRDRDELSGSAELGPAIKAALEQTRFLIVLCSPNSAQSRWVNKEIEDFRAIANDANVLALIIEGEPNATTNPDVDDSLECFPPALRYPMEPLAGDLREEGDGKERGFLKILAGIADIGFDEIYRRHERAQRRKRLLIAAGASLIIAALAGLSVFAFSQKTIAEKKTRETEQALAGTRFVVANLRRKQGRVRESLRLLDQIPNEYRDVEWYLSRREVSGSDATIKAHQGSVNSIAIGNDRSWFVSAGEDGRVVVWETLTGEPIREVQFDKEVAEVALSPDEKFLAVATNQGLVNILQLNTLELVAELPNAKFISGLAFGKSGGSVSFLDQRKGIVCWNFDEPNSEPLRSIEIATESSNGYLSYSSDYEKLHYSNHSGIYSVTPETEERKTLISDNTRTTDLPFGFSPDGLFFAHAENYGPMGREDRIRIVEIASNRVTTTQSERLSDVPIKEIRFSPDSKVIAATRGSEIHAWSLEGAFAGGLGGGVLNVASAGPRVAATNSRRPAMNTISFPRRLFGQRQAATFIGHKSAVNALEFISDGRRMITGSLDGVIKIWSRENEQQAKLHLSDAPLKTLTVSQSSPVEVFASDGESAYQISTSPIRLESKISGKDICPSADKTSCVVLRSNGQLQLDLVRVNRSDGKETTIANTHIKDQSRDELEFGVDPTGQYAVVSEVFFDSANEDLPPFLYSLDSGEKLVALVELVDGEEITLGPINFSDDGKQVAVAYTRHSAKDVDWVRVWDTETLQVVKDIPLAEETIAIEFNAHKEQILIVQSDGILKWSIQSGASDGVIQLSKDSLAHATIRLHPGGNRLAVGINESILLINLESGEEVAEMSFRGYINDLRWSPDGTLLFGAMDNGTLQVWNASEKDGVFQAEKSSIDAYWHANQADKYEGSNDWFAALFHRAWLLKHDPKHPFAWCLLHDTHEKFQAQYSSGAAPVLPKIVVQMLELEKGDASNNMKLSRSDRAVGSSLMSRLIDESSWRESVRPRFAQAALQTINEKGVIVPTALALLEYRLENYSAAIDYANVAKDRRKKSEKLLRSNWQSWR